MMPLKIKYFFKKKIFIIIIILIVLVISSWTVTNVLGSLINSTLISLHFIPKNFNIIGNKIIQKNEIIKQICEMIQDKNSTKKCHSKWNTLYLSPWKIKNLLKTNFNWIKDVTVTRQIPDTFEIIIKEYIPFAIWNNSLVLDINGHTIDDKEFISKIGHNFIQVKSTLLDVFIIFISSIKKSNQLIQNIKSLNYINNRRWDLTLKNGLVIKLPESEPEIALFKLIKSDKNIFNSNNETKIIDIRIKDKTFLTE